MGCNKSKVPSNPETSQTLTPLIDKNDSIALQKILKTSSESFSDLRFCVNSLSVNILGYSLAKGKLECFKVLLESFPDLLEQMEEILNSQGFRSIDLICMQGSVSMLNFYLPIYESIFLKQAKLTTNKSLTQTSNTRNKSISKTPVQYACFYGHFNIIRVIRKYYSATQTPDIFDLNSADLEYGEDCALMSCRLGCYKLIKFLFEECGASFNSLNSSGESALLILSTCSKKLCNSEFTLCFKYLLNVVKIDPRCNHKEILLALDNPSSLETYYEALQPFGIFPDKNMLEKLNEAKLPGQESLSFDEFFEGEVNKASLLSLGTLN